MKLLSTNLSRLDGALPSFAVPCEEPRTTGESVIRNSDLPQWLIPNLCWAVAYQDGKGNKGRIPNWEDLGVFCFCVCRHAKGAEDLRTGWSQKFTATTAALRVDLGRLDQTAGAVLSTEQL